MEGVGYHDMSLFPLAVAGAAKMFPCLIISVVDSPFTSSRIVPTEFPQLAGSGEAVEILFTENCSPQIFIGYSFPV